MIDEASSCIQIESQDMSNFRLSIGQSKIADHQPINGSKQHSNKTSNNGKAVRSQNDVLRFQCLLIDLMQQFGAGVQGIDEVKPQIVAIQDFDLVQSHITSKEIMAYSLIQKLNYIIDKMAKMQTNITQKKYLQRMKSQKEKLKEIFRKGIRSTTHIRKYYGLSQACKEQRSYRAEIKQLTKN